MSKEKVEIITKSYTLPRIVADELERQAKAKHFRSVSHYLETILRDKFHAEATED